MSDEPEWSSDGRWIAFWNDRASGEATKGDIYIIRPDGSELRRLTRAPSLWHFNPSWQPVKARESKRTAAVTGRLGSAAVTPHTT